MKDIKDLKENECIHIRNKKEAKGIAKLCKQNNILNFSGEEMTTNWLHDKYRMYFKPKSSELVDKLELTNEIIIPASKFLKPSKKELLKRIEDIAYEVESTKKALSLLGEPKNGKPSNLEVDFGKVVSKSVYEAGKWYKDPESEFLVFVRNYDTEEAAASAYGFDADGVWFDAVVDIEGTVLASETEVKETLIKEAERRGFGQGVIVNRKGLEQEILDDEVEIGHLGTADFKYFKDTDTLECGHYCIYMKGKWAEIIEQPIEEIDFSQVGLIVEDGDLVVLTNGHYTQDAFGGMVISNVEYYKQGYIASDWAKQCFKRRKEPITISNEIN